MNARYRTLVTVATLLAGSAVASAYVFTGGKWAVQQVPYYINPANGHMSEAEATAAIQTAATGWTAQSNADIVLYYVGRTSGNSLTNNGRNEVFFRNVSNGSQYGESYWWFGSNGQLIDADVVFYTGAVRFYSDAAVCSGTGTYLQDAATHELGHLLGLGHSSVSTATMYPIMQWCSKTMRTLDSDDLAGIERLYPPGGTNTAPAVTILAPVNGAAVNEGTAVAFSGSATDREDGNLTSSLVWRSSINGQIGTGGSFSRALSAGSHTITASATDHRGAVTTQQVVLTVASAPSAPPPPAASSIALSARGFKVKGSQRTELTWSGAQTTSVNIFRNGVLVLTTSNDGAETDSLNRRGGGSYSYKLCEAGTTTCSATVTVSF